MFAAQIGRRLHLGTPLMRETMDRLTTTNPDEQRGHKVRAMLRARLGDDIFTSWFNALDFESFEASTVKFSVPVKFLRTWIQSHYSEDLLACCQAAVAGR